MNHATIWAAIDRVAIRLRMTRSGLARHCGMDATAFNKSKRFDKYGKPHWPSCITLSKVMLFAHLSPEEFGRIISEAGDRPPRRLRRHPSAEGNFIPQRYDLSSPPLEGWATPGPARCVAWVVKPGVVRECGISYLVPFVIASGAWRSSK